MSSKSPGEVPPKGPPKEEGQRHQDGGQTPQEDSTPRPSTSARKRFINNYMGPWYVPLTFL